MKKLGALLFGVMILCTAAFADALPQIRVVTGGGSFNPYSYTDEKTGELKGFEADMWGELKSRLADRYDVVLQSSTFSAIWGLLDSGRADIAACFFGINPERLTKYLPSVPYAGDPVGIAVLVDSGIYRMSDLKGKTVGVAAGSSASDLLNARAEEMGLKVKTYEAFTEVMADLALERLDACANDIIAIHSYNKTGKEVRVLEEKLTQSKIAYFALKTPEAEKKMAAVNQALESMLADGTVKDLCEKWFGSDLASLRGSDD